uniref:Uncharacterized protein n=1 Tax=Noccaea caerulescens TaxID=107243 RepID=A0A1J3JKL8_NOCCA
MTSCTEVPSQPSKLAEAYRLQLNPAHQPTYKASLCSIPNYRTTALLLSNKQHHSPRRHTPPHPAQSNPSPLRYYHIRLDELYMDVVTINGAILNNGDKCLIIRPEHSGETSSRVFPESLRAGIHLPS